MAKIKMGIVDYAKELVDEELYIKSLSGNQRVKAEKFFKALNDMFARNAKGIVVETFDSITLEDAFKEAFARNESTEKSAAKIINQFYLDGFDEVEMTTGEMVAILKDFLDFVPQSSIVPGGVVRTQTKTEETAENNETVENNTTEDDNTNGLVGGGNNEIDALVKKAIRIIKDDSFVNTLDGEDRTVANDLFQSLKREVQSFEDGFIMSSRAAFGPLPGRRYSPSELREVEYFRERSGYNLAEVLRVCFLRHRENEADPNIALKMAYSHGTAETHDTRSKILDNFMDFVRENVAEKGSENSTSEENNGNENENNQNEEENKKEENTNENETGNGNGSGNGGKGGSGKGRGKKGDKDLDKDDDNPENNEDPKKKKPRKKKEKQGTKGKKTKKTGKRKIREMHVDKAMKMGLLLAEPKRGFWEKLFHRPGRLAVIGGITAAVAIGAGIMLGPGAYYGLSALSKFGLMFSGVVPGAIIGGATYGIGRAVLSKVSKNVKKSVLKDKFDRGLKKCNSLEKVSNTMTNLSEHFREKATVSYKDRKGLLKIRALHKAARKFDRAILGKVFRPLERNAKKAHSKKVMETIGVKADLNELENATGKSMAFAGLKEKVEKKSRKAKKAEVDFEKKKSVAKKKIAEIEKKFKDGKISEEDKDIEIANITDDLAYEESVLGDKQESAMEAIEHYNEKYRDKDFNSVGDMSGDEYQDFLEENNVNMSEHLDQQTYDLETSELYAHLSEKKRKELSYIASLDEKGQKKYLDKTKDKSQAEADLKVAKTMAGIMDRIQAKQSKGKKKVAKKDAVIEEIEMDNPFEK